MKKNIIKTILIIMSSILGLLILWVVVGSFLIPIQPLDDLILAQDAALENSQFVTIPFQGTDGIDIRYIEEQST